MRHDRLANGYVPDFDLDAEVGRQAELYVASIADALRDGTVEVKADEKARRTGNVFIEYECFRQGEWRRSGIATTAAEVWAIVVAGEVMSAAPSRMVRHVARYSRPHERRECMRGSHPTRGVVIPMGEFLQRLAQVPTVEAAA